MGGLELLVLVAVLILLNGFFVAAEFALVKIRASQQLKLDVSVQDADAAEGEPG